MIDWNKVSRLEMELITEIAQRASKLAEKYEIDYEYRTAMMDVAAVHTTLPLRLDEFAKGRDEDFNHDILGIRKFINRQTGELEGSFVPRFALRTTAQV